MTLLPMLLFHPNISAVCPSNPVVTCDVEVNGSLTATKKRRLRNLKKECTELEETNVMLKKFVANLETEVAEYRVKIAALLKSAQSNSGHV
ncbi:unnamed protein product [Heligmosomoides polygyrus]|uniref:BZIP domain-containing protein n=1 Tax=Heligmosomoides polygyrus TaxID=6339 RepID=A0A183GE34_HELPZ|nr:unnamed protein product [Heligmosomoides polygyrus]